MITPSRPASRLTRFLVTAIFLTVVGSNAPAQTERSEREGIEWCDIWLPNLNKPAQPRVLLIGDSITRNYYPEVEKRLAGKAFVARLTTSAFIGDPMFHDQLKSVLAHLKFDVIHFNNGLHGMQYTEAEYRKAFPEFLATLARLAPTAKLIWATTTPPKPPENMPANSDATKKSGERVTVRNGIALEFVKAKQIPVDDLNALMTGHPEYYRDGLHFKPEAVTKQAEQVAGEIGKLL